VADFTALPLAGTEVHLTIRPPLTELLGGGFILSFLLFMSNLMSQSGDSSRVALIPAGFGVLFALFFLASTWWSIRRAERYFQEALALKRIIAHSR
jgi:hypothetical protein